jgi:hypothetical protein
MARISAADTPGTMRAVEVARIPRAIGTITGVKEMVGVVAPAERKDCWISGMWRCVPPTA